jgi:peptidoglycan hydrolase-like protein with peptidoglycan-binding domain
LVVEKLMNIKGTVDFAEFQQQGAGEQQLFLNRLQQDQAVLSVRAGGFGLQPIRDTAAGAFIAAMLTTIPPLARRLEASRQQVDQERLEQLRSSPRVQALHRALKTLLGEIGEDDSVPLSWREWAARPEGAIPSTETLAARELQQEEGQRGRQWKHQRDINKAVSTQRQERLMEAARHPQEDRGDAAGMAQESVMQTQARLLSLNGAAAGAWIHAKPSEGPLGLAPEQTQLAIRGRLGVAERFEGDECVGNACATRGSIDARHATYCMRSGGPQKLHTALLAALQYILRQAKIPFRAEDTAPFDRRRDRSGRQQAMDVVISAGVLTNSSDRRFVSKGVMLDITCANPLAPAHLHSATSSANFAGAAGAHATTTKTQQYQGSFNPATYTLWPMALESCGSMCGSTMEVLDAVAEHVVGGVTSPRFQQKGALLGYYRQVLSVALQRGMANSVLSFRRRLEAQRGGVEWDVGLEEAS